MMANQRCCGFPKVLLLQSSLLCLISLWAFFKLSIFIYNISPFHPLSQFPGPKFAQMTFCYEAWYDLVKNGRYTSQIEKMYKQYGPLVCINPSELHCNDLQFIDEIYATGGRKRNKSEYICQSLVTPIDRTGFGIHILQFEAEVLTKLQYLCDKYCKGQKAFDITTAYSCFTTDIISAFSFGEPLGLLTQEGWEPNWRQSTYSFLRTTLVFRSMPFLKKFVGAGKSFARRGYMGRDVKTLMETLFIRVPEMVSQALAGTPNGYATPFKDIAESLALLDTDKELDRLSAEGMALLMAGTETTAWSLSVITFYLISQPGILSRLTRELKGAFSEEREFSWVELEKIPYLKGVIMEGLRLSYGVSGRTPRIAQYEDLVQRALWYS
ncbi:cytochrome P450 [Diaporthe sp. PMI_573]|nr:cytochrome P450 [Diaporthaceae sp. PMI_573]